MATSKPKFPAWNFKAIIPGISDVGFHKISGLSSEVATIPYRTGDMIELDTKKFRGMVSTPQVKLSGGITSNADLLIGWYRETSDWRQDRGAVKPQGAGKSGPGPIRTVTIEIHNQNVDWDKAAAAIGLGNNMAPRYTSYPAPPSAPGTTGGGGANAVSSRNIKRPEKNKVTVELKEAWPAVLEFSNLDGNSSSLFIRNLVLNCTSISFS